jgi:hypothetical protein
MAAAVASVVREIWSGNSQVIVEILSIILQRIIKSERILTVLVVDDFCDGVFRP